jgi:hypothetical protein
MGALLNLFHELESHEFRSPRHDSRRFRSQINSFHEIIHPFGYRILEAAVKLGRSDQFRQFIFFDCSCMEDRTVSIFAPSKIANRRSKLRNASISLS